MRKIQLALWAIVLATCTAGAVSQPAATVNVNQHTLFVLHSGMGSISVTEWAQLVNQRLRYILKSPPAIIARARAEGLILHSSVTIGYSTPQRKVHELLLQAAERTSYLLKSPNPFVLQTVLNDFYLSYQLNVYTSRANEMTIIYAERHQNIQDAFNEEGIEICSPHYHQLRDGNPISIPSDYLKDYEPPLGIRSRRERESIGALIILVMLDIMARVLLRTASKYVVEPTSRNRDRKLIVCFSYVFTVLLAATIFTEEVSHYQVRSRSYCIMFIR